jgi:hypothetical protein
VSDRDAILNALHEALGQELLTRIRSGEAKPADLAVAVKFLKDNGISVVATPDNPVGKLMDELPFDVSDTIN